MHQMGQILPDSARSLLEKIKYVIETGKNLSYDESIKVSYQVKLKEASLSGKTLKNTATGKADFVKPVSAVRLVKIKKESKSTVTTGNKSRSIQYF